MDKSQARIILVDTNDESREVMIRRLHAQGYAVEATADPAHGAELALAEPPAAVIADLWMPSISGVQLCRLLRAEAATADVPIVLRGLHDDPRSRFWTERAGATAYVVKGRMAELVRVLSLAVTKAPADGFFLQLSGGSRDIRDRIARHLDVALFESVIAAEVRALASSGSFERLFDLFSQFLSQVISYRWVAAHTQNPRQFGLHHHPRAASSEPEARAALGIAAGVPLFKVVDEDAGDESQGEPPIICDILFGTRVLGRLALAPSTGTEADTPALVALVARELAGPIRITELIEESQRLATIDALTGLTNRRAFTDMIVVEIARCARYGMPLSLLMLDVDHFKSVNDTYGHAVGDQVLAEMGDLLQRELRIPDSPARWGGEEFVVALKNTDVAGAMVVGERIRASVQALMLQAGDAVVRPTVSIGVAAFQAGDSFEKMLDRADQAMYQAKTNGRNRMAVASAASAESEPQPSPILSLSEAPVRKIA